MKYEYFCSYHYTSGELTGFGYMAFTLNKEIKRADQIPDLVNEIKDNLIIQKNPITFNEDCIVILISYQKIREIPEREA